MNFPTQLTVLRIILTPVFVILLFLDNFTLKLVSFAVFMFACFTDFYDGYFAKKYGYVTKLGKFLDPLADKILISTAFIAFHVLGYINLWVVVVIIGRDVLITALRSYAIQNKKDVATSYIARVKTFIQMGAIFFMYVFFLVEQHALSQHDKYAIIYFLNKIFFVDIIMAIVAILTAYTGIKYLVDNRTHLSSFYKSFLRVFSPSE